MKEKPSISLIASEVYIIFVHNKTIDWLNEKTDQEKSLLLSQARKDVNSTRCKFMTRISEIERRRGVNLEDKMKKAEELGKARFKRLEDYTNAILDWGLW